MKLKSFLILGIFTTVLVVSTFAFTDLVVYNEIALISSNYVLKNANNLVVPTTNSAMINSFIASSKIDWYEFHAAENYSFNYFLKSFTGKIVQFQFATDNTVKDVRIISSDPVIIERVDTGKVYFSPSGQFIFPSVPQIDSQNYFLVSTNATTLSYSYMTNGIGWNGIYSLNIDTGKMDGSIHLWNKNDTSFKDFDLFFVSGMPFTSQNRNQPLAKAFMATAAPVVAPQFQSVGGYKVYTYGKVSELDANSSVFLPLFSKIVKTEKLNVVYNPSENLQNAVQIVRITHDFPIPTGTISIYTTSNGVKYFLGQSDVTDTASMIALDIKYGQNFDLSAQQVQTQRTMIAKDLYSYKYEITAFNSSSKSKGLWIYTYVPSDATLTSVSSGVKVEKYSVNELRFLIELSPNSKEVFTYAIQSGY